MSEKVKTGVFWISLSAYIILTFAFPDSPAIRASGILVVAAPSLLAELLFLLTRRSSIPKNRLTGELIYAGVLLLVLLFGVVRLLRGSL